VAPGAGLRRRTAGSKTSLTYTYTLPRNTFESDKYKLRLIKQSGSETFYKLTVEAPEGRLIESDDFETRENRAMFNGQLKK
jgi:DNA/RNA-binding domain of Phe-tRNA-synthetase-like protein